MVYSYRLDLALRSNTFALFFSRNCYTYPCPPHDPSRPLLHHVGTAIDPAGTLADNPPPTGCFTAQIPAKKVISAHRPPLAAALRLSTLSSVVEARTKRAFFAGVAAPTFSRWPSCWRYTDRALCDDGRHTPLLIPTRQESHLAKPRNEASW